MTVAHGRIDRSNSERAGAAAAAAAAGVSVTHHAGGKKARIDTQGMVDQLVLSISSVDKELTEAIKAVSITAPSAAVESPDLKRSRKTKDLSDEIKRLIEKRSREPYPVYSEKLTKKIARKRKQRDEPDGDSEEDE